MSLIVGLISIKLPIYLLNLHDSINIMEIIIDISHQLKELNSDFLIIFKPNLLLKHLDIFIKEIQIAT